MKLKDENGQLNVVCSGKNIFLLDKVTFDKIMIFHPLLFHYAGNVFFKFVSQQIKIVM